MTEQANPRSTSRHEPLLPIKYDEKLAEVRDSRGYIVAELAGARYDHGTLGPLIVRAVNAHDDLVDIVRQLDATCDGQVMEHVQWRRADIRAALKKAGAL